MFRLGPTILGLISTKLSTIFRVMLGKVFKLYMEVQFRHFF